MKPTNSECTWTFLMGRVGFVVAHTWDPASRRDGMLTSALWGTKSFAEFPPMSANALWGTISAEISRKQS